MKFVIIAITLLIASEALAQTRTCTTSCYPYGNSQQCTTHCR